MQPAYAHNRPLAAKPHGVPSSHRTDAGYRNPSHNSNETDNPYIFISAHCLPTEAEYRRSLSSRLLRYKPVAIQFKPDIGWYILFSNTFGGRQLAERCWKENDKTSLDGRYFRMTYYQSGCPLKVNEYGEVVPRNPNSFEPTQRRHETSVGQAPHTGQSPVLPRSPLLDRLPSAPLQDPRSAFSHNQMRQGSQGILRSNSGGYTAVSPFEKSSGLTKPLTPNQWSGPEQRTPTNAFSRSESLPSSDKGTPLLRQIVPRPSDVGSLSSARRSTQGNPVSIRDEDAMSISSTSDIHSNPSSASGSKCWKCRKSESTSFDPLVRCVCKRSFHPKCHFPFIQPEQPMDPNWRCERCVRKRAKQSSGHDDTYPKQSHFDASRSSDGGMDKSQNGVSPYESKTDQAIRHTRSQRVETKGGNETPNQAPNKMSIQYSLEPSTGSPTANGLRTKGSNESSYSSPSSVFDRNKSIGTVSANGASGNKNGQESGGRVNRWSSVNGGTSEGLLTARPPDTRASSASMSMDTSLSDNNLSPEPEQKRVLQVGELLSTNETRPTKYSISSKELKSIQALPGDTTGHKPTREGAPKDGITPKVVNGDSGNHDHTKHHDDRSSQRGRSLRSAAISETPESQTHLGNTTLQTTESTSPRHPDSEVRMNKQSANAVEGIPSSTKSNPNAETTPITNGTGANHEAPSTGNSQSSRHIKLESKENEAAEGSGLNHSFSTGGSSAHRTSETTASSPLIDSNYPFTTTPSFKGDNRKPNMTYVQLVTEAFSHSRTGELTTVQICFWIMQTYRHYAEDWTKEVLCSRLSAILSQYPQFTKHPPKKDSGSKYCTYTLENSTDAQTRARKRKRSESVGSVDEVAKEQSQRAKSPPPTRRRADDASDASMPPGASQEYIAKAGGSGVIDRIRPDIKRWESLQALAKASHDSIDYNVGDIVKIRLGEAGSEFARIQEMKVTKDNIIAVAVLWFVSKQNRQTKYHGEWPDGCSSILTNCLEVCKLGTIAGRASDEELKDMHLGSKILDVTSRTAGRESAKLRDQEEPDLTWTDYLRQSSRPVSRRINNSQSDQQTHSPATPNKRSSHEVQHVTSTSSRRRERSRNRSPDYRSTRIEDLPGPERFLALKALADAKAAQNRGNRQADATTDNSATNADPPTMTGLRVETPPPSTERRNRVAHATSSEEVAGQPTAKDMEIAKLKAELDRVRSHMEHKIPWAIGGREDSFDEDLIEVVLDGPKVELEDFDSIDDILALHPEYRPTAPPSPSKPHLMSNRKANFGRNSAVHHGDDRNNAAGAPLKTSDKASEVDGETTTRIFPSNPIPFNHNGWLAYRDGTKDANGNYVNPNSIHVVRRFTEQDQKHFALAEDEGKDGWGWSR